MYVKLILVEALLQLIIQTSALLIQPSDESPNELQTAVWLTAGTASSQPPPRHLVRKLFC